ncbi:RNI-like protein [Daedalea quercina L-15889]|uniref:RNI-like protein n=1 Tax=Daedalea quercina L-15889 TaxID=1314783 RepID=A0A165Q777_9APHY|nr:RNI-like protein [Daedalea quercina L-15889]
MDPRVFSLSRSSTTRRMSAAKVPLSARSHIESLDAGLCSVEGALEVIQDIRARRNVTKLILGHNELGDAGCEVLFGFLSTDKGRQYPISEISLNSNGIGDRGLRSIIDYLRNNTSLKELFLQNNAFTADSDTAAVFAEALNTSQLETLSLTTNAGLADAFIARFLPFLDAPYLQEMQISVLGLTHASAPHIVEYISSPRCRLRALRANGNRLGLRGARAIVRAIHRHNFTLAKLEMYANGLADVDPNFSGETSASDDDDALRAGGAFWQDSEKELARALQRNKLLREATEREAINLLRYARAVLLKPRNASVLSTSQALVLCTRDSLLAPISLERPLAQPFRFTSLPIELQLHVLSFLAPTLSSAQCIRIYTYASSPTTLPPLLPPLASGGNLPDPATLPFGGVPMGVGMMLRKRRGFASECDGVVTGSKPVTPGSGRKAEERARWLTMTRCDAFELEEDGDWSEADVLALRA